MSDSDWISKLTSQISDQLNLDLWDFEHEELERLIAEIATPEIRRAFRMGFCLGYTDDYVLEDFTIEKIDETVADKALCKDWLGNLYND